MHARSWSTQRGTSQKATTTTFQIEGGKFFLTYDLFGLAIRKFTQCSTDRKDCRIDNLAPSQLNSGYKQSSRSYSFTKILWHKKARYIKFESRKNLKGDTAKTWAGNWTDKTILILKTAVT